MARGKKYQQRQQRAANYEPTQENKAPMSCDVAVAGIVWQGKKW